MVETGQSVWDFWFKELKPAQWYAKDAKLDQRIRERFLPTWQAAIRGELYAWRRTPQGRLAEIIVLDQFSRNMFRERPEAFAGDPIALTLAQEAVEQKLDVQLSPEERGFLYSPYMHSESLVVHREAMRLYGTLGEDALYWEKAHIKIIERFGRYPHRNKILGRKSTPEEEAFLKEPGSSF